MTSRSGSVQESRKENRTVLQSLNTLRGYRLAAQDGELGRVHDCLFDDERWRVRYFVVDTRVWLPGRKVLILASSCGPPQRPTLLMPVNLTREQVKKGPSVDLARPVSRQRELDLHRYYGALPYWTAPEAPVIPRPRQPAEADEPGALHESSGDEHLRSVAEVTGYHIEATDGAIGHVEDFVAEEHDWTIRWMVVDTRKWLPGRKVLVAPSWIRRVTWSERSVEVEMTREAIRQSPAYDPTQPVGRDYEERLHEYYQRPVYWL